MPGSSTTISNEQLLSSAEALDASMAVMNGSAYHPSREAVRALRVLATNRTIESEAIAEGIRKLIEELHHFSNTIARPGRDKMQEAARLLSTLLEEQRFS